MKAQAGQHAFLKEAYSSLRKKRYKDAQALLENLTASKPEDPYPWFLLAIVYLFSDRFDRAHGIMDRLKRLNPDYIPLVQLQAFLYFKSATSYESAMGRYMELVEKYPADARIAKALRSIRENRDFILLQKHARLQDFVDIPRPGRIDKKRSAAAVRRSRIYGKHGSRSWKKVYLTAGILAFVCTIAIAAYFLVPWPLKSTGLIPGAARIDTDTIDRVYLGEPGYSLLNPVSREKPLEFYYSNHDVLADFDRAKRLIKDGRHNEALLILNKLNNSNARFTVKEKIEFLIKFVIDMEDRSYEKVPYETIRARLHLYRGFALAWEGKISNLKNSKTGQGFTLLIDYKKNDIFSGIADVYSDSQYGDLANGNLVEIKGVFVNTMGDDRRLYLIARDVRKL